MTGVPTHLKTVRTQVLKAYRQARRLHRGQGKAGIEAFRATTNLLRAEVATMTRQKKAAERAARRPAEPDLFGMGAV